MQRLAYCVLEKPNIQSTNSTELKTAAFAALEQCDGEVEASGCRRILVEMTETED